MGYDFMFERMRVGPSLRFPVSAGEDADVEPACDADDVRLNETLAAFPGMRPNGTDAFAWESPAGALIFFPSRGGVYVDTHASWRCVLELYLYLRTSFSDLLIIDPQTAVIHDEGSFRALIERRERAAAPRARRDVDPLEELVAALDSRRSPTAAWLAEWTIHGGDAVVAAWDASADAKLMLRLLDGLDHPAARKARAAVEALDRLGRDPGPVIRRLVATPPTTAEFAAAVTRGSRDSGP